MQEVRCVLPARVYILRGNGALFLRSNRVCFCLPYNRWNDGIQRFQHLEERFYEATDRQTKKYLVETS